MGTCLEATSGCGFCADKGKMYKPGACLTDNARSVQACQNENRAWINSSCPQRAHSAKLAVNLLATYVAACSTGLGTVSWILNSEMYPVQLKGLCSGIAVIGYWFSGLIVSASLMNSTKAVDPVNSMLVMGLTSCVIMWCVELFVPETAGLSCLEVEKLLENSILKFWKSKEAEDVNGLCERLLPGDEQFI